MLKIRPASLSDLNSIADIHIRSFQGFFLTLMGRRFLEQLYRCFISYSDGLCIVACENDEIVGFAAGALRPEVFFRRVKRRKWFAFTVAALPAIFLRPHRILRRLIAAIFSRGEVLTAYPNAALLSSIAVEPRYEGKGIGRKLVSAFCQKIQDAGLNAVYLTTDRDNNDRVNKFYLQLGFSIENTFVQSGKRVMNLYALKISK